MKKFTCLIALTFSLAGCASPYTPRDMEYFDVTKNPIMYGENWALERRAPVVYPIGAGLNGQSGCVILAFTIDKSGQPTDIKAAKSYPEEIFDHNARVALSFWRWALIKDGTAEPYSAVVQADFHSGLPRSTRTTEACDNLSKS